MQRHLLAFRKHICAALVAMGASASAHAATILPTITYDDLNAKTLYSATTFFSDSIGFELVNNTNETWTDFHFDILDCSSCVFGSYGGSGSSTIDGLSLDVFGLSIVNGGTYSGYFFVSSPSTTAVSMDLTGYPTVGQSVPEPAALALVGLGLAGLGLARQRQAQ